MQVTGVRDARDGKPTSPKDFPWLQFVKYEGLGNDFILVDQRKCAWPEVDTAQAVRLCDRHRGIGADGVILLLPAISSGADFRVRIVNADGSEPEMCGNGIRCVAKYAVDLCNDSAAGPNEASTFGDGALSIETGAGYIRPRVLSDGRVCVDMGPPILDPQCVPTTLPGSRRIADVEAAVEVPLDGSTAEDIAAARLPLPPPECCGASEFVWRCTAVSMGNPHCVIFVDQKTFAWVDANLERIGPMFETHHCFPRRTNTEFIEVCGPRDLRMSVWERGAGRTMACGTGACAAVVAATISGRIPSQGAGASGDPVSADACVVHLPGGDLEIYWSPENRHVYMTGPANFVYRGECLLESSSL